MPRGPRVVLTDYPHHVRQQGHNRKTVFAKPADYRFYLDTLAEWKSKLGCRIYAYCLMTNHVHLIVDPGAVRENLALLMKRLAGRYTRHVNRARGRSGTVWNGRYKSSPIDTDDYLLACARYIELNPVRASMVVAARDYPWSSYRAKVGLAPCPWLDEDPCYTALGGSPRERLERYRRFLASAVPHGEWELIRSAIQRSQLSGSNRFQELVARRIGCRVEFRGPGRPEQLEKNKSVPIQGGSRAMATWSSS